MNPKEQKDHRTALRDLEDGVLAFSVETMKRLDALAARIGTVEARINEERALRLKRAEEQRAYVDARNGEVWLHVEYLYRRGFWSRINWLLTGR